MNMSEMVTSSPPCQTCTTLYPDLYCSGLLAKWYAKVTRIFTPILKPEPGALADPSVILYPSPPLQATVEQKQPCEAAGHGLDQG